MFGNAVSGSTDSEEVVEQHQILLVGVGEPISQPRTDRVVAQFRQARGRPKELCCCVERNVACVGFAECPEHVCIATDCRRHDLAHQPALPDAGRTDEGHRSAVALHRPFQVRLDRCHFPVPANEPCFTGSGDRVGRLHTQQSMCGHRIVGAL